MTMFQIQHVFVFRVGKNVYQGATECNTCAKIAKKHLPGEGFVKKWMGKIIFLRVWSVGDVWNVLEKVR